MIIYVWDEDWPGNFNFSTIHSQNTLEHTVGIIVSRTDSIPKIVQRIISFSEGKGSIWLLKLCGHGNYGYLKLGKGLTITSSAHLSSLKPYFTKDGKGIEIHGCGVASSTNILRPRRFGRGTINPAGKGEIFLRAVAAATGVTVKGGVNMQYTDARYEFEGTAITVFP